MGRRKEIGYEGGVTHGDRRVFVAQRICPENCPPRVEDRCRVVSGFKARQRRGLEIGSADFSISEPACEDSLANPVSDLVTVGYRWGCTWR